jgi:hypothetical protein
MAAKLYEPGELIQSEVPLFEVPKKCFNITIEVVHAKEAISNDQELGAHVRKIIDAYKFTT